MCQLHHQVKHVSWAAAATVVYTHAYFKPQHIAKMEDDYEEEVMCPICCEELDATDRAVHYCQCGFQPCLWCFHQILETAANDSLPGRCPNCRSEYDKNKVTMSNVDPGV